MGILCFFSLLVANLTFFRMLTDLIPYDFFFLNMFTTHFNKDLICSLSYSKKLKIIEVVYGTLCYMVDQLDN